ncbi:MAG: AAA family ATPase, partial [Armatimonadetes bacterium]|nr:AAA family ATPase [Armatimonadota bacterium]
MLGWMAGALGAAGDAGAAQGQRLQYVGQVVNEFMGTDCSSLPIVSRPFALSALVDLNQALLDFAAREQMSVRLQGYNAHYHMNDLRSVVSLGQDFRLPVAPVQYNQVERGPGELINCVTDGLFLLGGDEQAMVVQLRLGEYRQSLEVSAMARTADEAGRCLEWLARRIQEASIFRGRVVSLECSHVAYGPESSTVRIHRFPAVRRDEVILPESTMSLLERSTIRYFEHAAALRRSGRAVRHGVLLHGKPGTGKTYTAMWLAGRLEGVTVILLAAEQLGLIRQCCQMARMLQPSMVIMEDVDLVAISRDLEAPIQARVTLHQLLNEMDGLEPESEILFLLT